MTELRALPNVETAFITYLADRLGPLADRVAGEVPSPRPDRLVTVALSGSGGSNLAQRTANITVQAWASDRADAFPLAQRAQAVIDATPGSFVGPVWVYRVEQGGGPVWLPDPDTRCPRYQFLSALTVRVTVL